MKKNNDVIHSVTKAFSILECFLKGEEFTFTEICDMTGLSATTVHRQLNTLQVLNYLARNDNTKRYYLGYKISSFSVGANYSQQNNLRNTSLPTLVSLRNKTKETVSIFIIKGNNRVCIERVLTTSTLQHIRSVGDTLPLGIGASGKVLLAYLTDEKLEEITPLKYLEPDVKKKIIDSGYAISIGEREEGITAVSAPIFSYDNKCIAAISTTGPSTRVVTPSIQEIISSTKQAALEISIKMGSRPSL